MLRSVLSLRPDRPIRVALILAAALSAALACAAPAAGQEEPRAARPDTLDLDEGVSPTGAFLRAVALPGWGHAAIGSHRRGAFYVASQGGVAWMLVRTRSRLHDARRIRDLREAMVTARLALEGVTDPTEVEEALAADERVDDARDLVDARSQQFEDWAALGIFLVLLSGADAFVSAHLQDFPVPIAVEAAPLPEGRAEIGLRIPVGGGGRRWRP